MTSTCSATCDAVTQETTLKHLLLLMFGSTAVAAQTVWRWASYLALGLLALLWCQLPD